jgi:bzd-type benzoyl-CoA reductase N subunit
MEVEMEAVKELVELSGTLLNRSVEDWKEQDKKVMGFFCSYVPEEIIHAAGMLPYRVRATGCTETTAADVYLSHLNCSFVRSCLEFALKGEYKFLDGVVFMNSCDHVRRLYDIFREAVGYPPFMHFISVPHKAGGNGALNWYKGELAEFKERIEGSFGVKITDEALKNAIDVYNETRSLLKRLYQLRGDDKPRISGAESLSLILAATSMPKEQYNRLLAKALQEIEEREAITNYRARLMIAGSVYDDVDYTKVIEDLGGLIVSDALCFGSRYFWGPVEVGDDLWAGLAQSYLNRPSCARMTDRVAERTDFVREMVERFKVDGVIFQRIRYCDLWGSETLYLERRLKELDIPLLQLDREYMLSGVGQLKTRVQAFLERIER